jgi:SprT protein
MHKSLLLGNIDDQQLSHKKQLMQVLKRYLPPGVVEYCSELIMLYKLHLHIEIERKDRLGDYSPHLGHGNRISINHNLNQYDFLITFIHELAHHTAYKKYGPNHQSHGTEWKEEFKNCMRPVVMMKIFPPDIELPLIKHMQLPKYTHSGDVQLMKALMKYNKGDQHLILDDLPMGTHFKMSLRARITLKKMEKLRSYVLCEDVDNGKKYKVHLLAKVYKSEGQKSK